MSMYDEVRRWCEEIRMLLKKEISVRSATVVVLVVVVGGGAVVVAVLC